MASASIVFGDMFLRNRPSYANVASTLALFIALGGTSYAVTALPRNSVGTVQIRAGAVTPEKLAETARTLRGPRGTAGPTGPQGERGPSEAFAVTAPSLNLGGPSSRTTVAVLPAVPAGSYMLTGHVSVGDFTNPAWIFRCAIYVNGVNIVQTHVVVGTSAGSVRAADLSPLGFTTQPAAFRATLECFPDQTVTPSPPLTEGRFVAVRVGNIS